MGLTEDDRIGRENGEVGVQFVEEVPLVGGAADAIGKQEHITLQP